MAKCQLMHNDLHGNNIFIQHLEEPRLLQYEINGLRIAFATDIKVSIYDFDRATCPSLGENRRVTQPLTRARGETAVYRPLERFEPNRDLAILCKWLKKTKQLAASALGHFVQLHLSDRVKWYQAYGREVPTPLGDAIQSVAAQMNQVPWQPDSKTYVINDYMFNIDGSLNTGHVALRNSLIALDLKGAMFARCQTLLSQMKAELEASEANLQAARNEIQNLTNVMELIRP
jgi:hypothetical protein